MHIVIPRADLKRLVDSAAKVVERRVTIPILAMLRISAADGRVTVTGTDLDIEASAAADCEVRTAGTTTVDAQMLGAIVTKLPADAAVTLRLDGDRCHIAAGRAKFQAHSLPAEDYPEAAPVQPTATWRMPAARFGALVAPTLFAISTEETRYYLNGVFLHAHEGCLRAVATDGHRLSLAEIPLPDGAAGLPDVIVPRKMAELLVRRAGEAADWSLAVSEAAIEVAADGWRLRSKLIDGTFPEYARVIPDPARASLVCTVDRPLLAAVVDRLGAVMAERSRATQLDFDGGTLRLSTRNPDAGTAEETIDVQIEGEVATAVGFNGRYLGEICGALTSPEIRIRLADAGSPALISAVGAAVDAPGQTLVLMPMRV